MSIFIASGILAQARGVNVVTCYNQNTVDISGESVKDVFGCEIKCFEEHKPDLLTKAEGQYVLIKGDKLLGVFSCRKEAVKEGYLRLGNVPFLVKLIADEEQPITITSLLVQP